jgi:hypothetical protein
VFPPVVRIGVPEHPPLEYAVIAQVAMKSSVPLVDRAGSGVGNALTRTRRKEAKETVAVFIVR